MKRRITFILEFLVLSFIFIFRPRRTGKKFLELIEQLVVGILIIATIFKILFYRNSLRFSIFVFRVDVRVYLILVCSILFFDRHRNVAFCLIYYNLFIRLIAGLFKRDASLNLLFVITCLQVSLKEPNLGNSDLVFLTCLRIAVICDFYLEIWWTIRRRAINRVVLARSLTI